MKATTDLDNKIASLNDKELLARMSEAKNKEERNFWNTIYNRALQLRQSKIINICLLYTSDAADE